jgi:predicted dehydrogenase
MAQLSHFRGIHDSRVTAIFDPKPAGQARAREAAPEALVTGDWSAFLASGVNAVAVCSSDASHADYVVGCIEAGIHVVCEKPLTDSTESCRRILQAEAAHPGVIAAVQHQMRFLPVHRDMKALIDAGELGKIGYVEGYYVHNLTTRASQYDDWRFVDNATPLVYSGCHFVDLLRWLLDDEVEEIMGMANNIAFPEYPESDLNVLLMRFRSGVIGKVVVAFGAGRPQDHSVRVYGTTHSIENNLLFAKDGSYRVFSRPALATEPAQPDTGTPAAPRPFYSLRGRGYVWRLQRAMRKMRLSMPRYRTIAAGSLIEAAMRSRGVDREYEVAAYPFRLYPHNQAVRDSLENFVAAVRGQAPLLCPLKEAARTVATCCAGVEAYRTGRTVKVADFWAPELD